jgi:hypothetical protein
VDGRSSAPAAALTVVALLAAGGAALVTGAGRSPGGVPAIELVAGADDESPPSAVDVRGLGGPVLRALAGRVPDDAVWAGAIALRVDAGGRDTALPPVLAHYAVRGDGVRLTPRFPLAPGVAYRVVVDPAALARLSGLPAPSAPVAVERRFAVARREPERTTRVVGVHPAAARVPANLLRWYVELSAPMEPGGALPHVRLLDAAGREVPGAFLRLDEELWDPSRRRVTLLLDPGRVKRGIRTNVEEGAPLVAGRRYRLEVDAAWRDGRGAPLVSGFAHEFEVAPADRHALDVARWRVQAPRAGTREPLRVAFGEPLDHALAARLIAVHAAGAEGRVLDGAVSLDADDAGWRFVPAEPWRGGDYELRAGAALEDVAGNSLARVFDADRRSGDLRAEQGEAAGAWRGVRFVVR